jgi:hypothetical protein
MIREIGKILPEEGTPDTLTQTHKNDQPIMDETGIE